MSKQTLHIKQSLFFILWVFIFIILNTAKAHSPHDVIDALAVSPNFKQDKTVFIAISSSLRKSTDAGYSWSGVTNGLDNKYLFTDIVISPTFYKDKMLFVATSGDGVYKSENEGHSWTKINNGLIDLNISLISISPNYERDKVVLAVSAEGKLYRSSNGGKLWSDVTTEDTKLTALSFLSDSLDEQVLVGDEHGYLYVLSNQGRHWQRLEGDGLGSEITAIASSSTEIKDAEIFVGTKESLLFKSVDGGKKFDRVFDGLNASAEIVSIAVSPNYSIDNKLIISTWYDAVFISVNGGKQWQKYTSGITKDSQADKKKYHSPHFRDIQFSNDFGSDKIIFFGGFDGLFKSYDGGENWRQLETLPLRIVKGMGVGERVNGGRVLAVGTYGGGGYITEDDGKSWIIGNVGLKKTRLSGVVFSPDYVSDQTLFAGASGVLLKSMNSGNSWQRNNIELIGWRSWMSNSLIKVGLNSLAEIVLPPSLSRAPYPIKVVISPNYSKDKQIYFSTREHGVFKSNDAGASSNQVWNGLNKVVAELVISPNFMDDETLFASVRGKGIYKSEDSGKSWEAVNNGLNAVEDWKGEVIHGVKINDIFLAISENYVNDQTLFAATSYGLYKTVNGGNEWSKIVSLAYDADSYINTVAISPEYEKDGTVLASIKGKGLYISKNRDDTFVKWSTSLIDKNHDVSRILFSPTYIVDETVYAASYEDVFISKDKGINWKTIDRPVRYENHREVVRYSEGWDTRKGKEYSANMISYSESPGSDLSLNFVGTGVAWIGTQSDEQGKTRVYIDSQYKGDVDQFSGVKEALIKTYVIRGLSYGVHNIRIEVLGEKNPNSKSHRIEVDAFDILP